MTYPAAIAASRLCGLPLVVHLHATEYDRCGEIGYDKIYRIEREGLHAADRVITVSKRTKQLAIERYGVPPEKISVVYNGVIPLQEKPCFTVPRLVQNEKRVLFMARVAMQKGPDYFVEAARLVLDAVPDARFIMAGNGDMLPRMIRRAAELGMGSRFHFPGFMRGEDVRHMYSIASLYVMPSVSEPFGIAPLEALQCGTPVLLSKQSGSAEVLPDAFTVDFWDIREMADIIINILRHPEMAAESLRLCQQELKTLTWERAAENILEAYNHICPGGRS
ncbi:MAG: glycosyltransferase family 4 protein, partial [Clostridia bacterium]|nr:glycosyltransferase family 4 protein [Clostridia bacterium]